MMPKWHLLFGFILSYVLVYFFNFSIIYGVIVFLSSVFIDLDHVLVYFLETKSLHPKKFWEYSISKKAKWDNLTISEKESLKRTHFIFHGIEFILILILISIFVKILFLVLAGVLFHMVCDLIYLLYSGEHVSFKVSQFWLWHRNRSKKSLEQNI